MEAALAEVGRIAGKRFGDKADPLLVSVRSGARASMPGMMDTVLNLGLNDETVEALAKQVRRPPLRLRQLPPLHQMYSNVVLGVDHHHFEEILDEHKERNGYALDTDLDCRRLDRAGRAATRTGSRKSAASRSRRIRTSNCGARSARCSAPG